MLNVTEFLKIRAQIQAEPRALNMDSYVDELDCGTTACIAGWALLNNGATIAEVGGMGAADLEAKAAGILGLMPNVSHRVFHVTRWPTDIHDRWFSATTRAGEAAAAVEMIDYVIANNGNI